MPIQTLKVGSLGTHNTLGLAKAKGARFFLASTSEVYGDPQVHPQTESYWGHVNPVGPRGVYDEAKRFAEAMTMAYHRFHGLDVRIVRIFNTYGPRMRAARRAGGVELHRAGARRASRSPSTATAPRPAASATSTTRCGASSPCSTPTSTGPINIGNPDEFTDARAGRRRDRGDRLDAPRSSTSRCPSTTRRSAGPTSPWPARCSAGSRRSQLREGLERTAAYFRKRPGGVAPTLPGDRPAREHEDSWPGRSASPHPRAVLAPGARRDRALRPRDRRGPGRARPTSSWSASAARHRRPAAGAVPPADRGARTCRCRAGRSTRPGTALRWPPRQRATGPVDVIHATGVPMPPPTRAARV